MLFQPGSRPASFAGRLLATFLLLAGTLAFAAGDDPAELVKRADTLKTANNAEFQTLLKQLDALSGQLTPAQRDYLDYFKGWQSAYEGNYETSAAALQALVDRTQDATIRARALITLLNSQALASHYEEAYGNLSRLLDSLPLIHDHMARNFSYGVAAILYNQAGEYELAIKYADAWLADETDATAACKAASQKTESLYKLGRLKENDAVLDAGVRACQQIGDTLFANIIRTWQANRLIDAGRVGEALELLKAQDAQELATNSAASISQFRAVLARCYLLTGDLEHAREYALSAIDYGIKRAYSKWVADAYEVLYEAAKQQGHYQNALDYHEKYAAADKAYLNDTKARALAYQMVHQEVLDKKREVDALAEKNQLLQMQGQIDAKTSENRLLYIALLFVGLCAIALWAVRVKRSEQKFQKLARRDGLTGIHNRQHFFESATDTLRYCEKSARAASVLVMDLDHFKQINDEHGHAAGDEALRRVVAICQMRLRSIDIFGRLGGEEFAILLPDCAEDTAGQRAEEIRSAIASDAAGIAVTASFGVAATPRSGYELATLLAAADSALYAAKGSGRNRVATFRGAPQAMSATVG